VIGLIVTALALLLMFQQIFLGPPGHHWPVVSDLRPAELGVYPAPILGLANATATQLVAVFQNVLT
jgi:NADH-quinone oxidoreductase subunit M